MPQIESIQLAGRVTDGDIASEDRTVAGEACIQGRALGSGLPRYRASALDRDAARCSPSELHDAIAFAAARGAPKTWIIGVLAGCLDLRTVTAEAQASAVKALRSGHATSAPAGVSE